MSHGFEQGYTVFEDGVPCSCLFQQENLNIFPYFLQ